MNFTAAQLEAIREHGNILVMAGAGTGKTRTLVRRCVDRLLDPALDVGLDEVLVVTFTEAAAAEIRQRIRTDMESEHERHPDNGRLQAQLAMLDTAHICTLHSFCLQLVRQHFHELEVDPQLNVLAEESSAVLAQETLDALFQRHYDAANPASEAVLAFVQDHAGGWEERVREWILQVHHFTQTRPDPDGWFQRELEALADPEPARWRDWWLEAFARWRTDWLPFLQTLAPENPVAQDCATALEMTTDATGQAHSKTSVPRAAAFRATADIARATFESVINADDTGWPKGKKIALREPLKSFFDEARFLQSLVPSAEHPDPLAEDWHWVRPSLGSLLVLTREFAREFSKAKRERGALDFHDLEQFALKLLWLPEQNRPTDLAHQWRNRIKLLFVDEYQDINEAQDKILQALSREGTAANRFLVGDVKQSIYRFRQAAPGIFQAYATAWENRPELGRMVWLSDNFRSREGLLDFINPLFAALMKKALGGVDYEAKAALQFGDPQGRRALSLATSPGPRVEVHLHLKEKAEAEEPEEAEAGTDREELSDAETEARLVAMRLQALKAEGHQVWDGSLGGMRTVQWNDMVVLMRAPKFKVESFAKEFARLGVPLHAKRTGFFESAEVLDLVNMLTVLDNPLQDQPAAAVLRSPLAGLTLDELAQIRLAKSEVPYWTALRHWHALAPRTPAEHRSLAWESLFAKVSAFLERYQRWRALARQAPLARRLEMILSETAYWDWLLTQPRGEQRQANVNQLLVLARDFDALHAQGLHRFLRLIEAQKEAAGDREPAPLETEDAVRLMSIHQSKGLEFPVVVAAGLGNKFNLSQSKSGFLLDETFGLCPQVKPPQTETRYPSLPLWLARRHQRIEALGEELRLFYVALTRAKDTLILTGTCAAKTALETWQRKGGAGAGPAGLVQARCFLDWLGPWLINQMGGSSWIEQEAGLSPLWSWKIHRRPTTIQAPAEASQTEPALRLPSIPPLPEPSLPQALQDRLTWSYPRQAQVSVPAKSSVTALRRAWHAEAFEESASAPYVRRDEDRFQSRGGRGPRAAEIGTAHHNFLQWVDLERAGTMEGLEKERQRLQQCGRLSEEEARLVQLADVSTFFNSDAGHAIRAQSARVRREVPFTLRLAASDIAALRLPPVTSIPADDFVVVQGAVDLAVMLASEIWVLDFKTDRAGGTALEERIERYSPQVRLYADALERIHLKPVTRRWLHFLSSHQTVEV